MTTSPTITLPIREKEEELRELLANHRVIVVAGETGSGKTTQLPQICRELGYAKNGKIAVTQPRRIAATATAKRVAEEIKTPLGQEVGYKIRFAEKMSDKTEILFMTDGMLLAEMNRNRNLNGYSTIIIDEAHERSLNIDFLLGYLRTLVKKRSDLRVIISSATIDTKLFSEAFDNAPILEVSGRMFPVDIIYDPIEKGDGDYIDKAAFAVDQIIGSDTTGDTLIFMPTERDILETVDRLNGRKYDNCIVLPLFARLTRYQQNRIFENSRERKIIVSTNVAETSLTVPGIKFVIDTGLARVSRYAPNLRTNRLPIEDVSQAEAMQRSGRSGRVSEGVCIRLYDEKNFEARPPFRTAEIKRSNLAGVILSMMSMKLGDIDKFPFLEKPEKRATGDAFSQLYELGAIDSSRRLTPLGRKMSNLPLEPHISRMILQASREGVIVDVAIIAAGLSIIDPRERPLDMQEAADEMHKKFIDERSDFLTLLKLWESYHKNLLDLKTQSKMRKHCKAHFLNYNRMREWGDVHKQITGILKQAKIKGQTKFSDDNRDAAITAIHKSIFAGLLSNLAFFDKEEKLYRATRNRLLTIFPGSVVAKKKKRPNWIMAQEVVETSRVFARTVGPVNPVWVEEFVPHLLKRNYGVPYFSPEKGSALVEERLLFSGLCVVEGRTRFYGSVDIKKAKELFIHQALVEGEARGKLPFLEKNRKFYSELLEEEAKLRTVGFVAGEEDIYKFYDERLPDIASVRDLIGFIKKSGGGKDLELTREDVIVEDLPSQSDSFPTTLSLGAKNLPLKYRYDPGAEDDGITVTVPLSEVAFIRQNSFGWLVEPLWAEKIGWLLKSLSKSERKQFAPISDSANKIAKSMKFDSCDFREAVSKEILNLFGIKVSANSLSEEKLPEHLKMRILVVDRKGKTVETTRDPDTLADVNSRGVTQSGGDIEKLLRENEVKNLSSWSFGDLQPQKEISRSKDGYTLYGFPALVKDGDFVKLTWQSDPEVANKKHRVGVGHLLKVVLRKDLDWLEKDLKFTKELKLLSSPFGGEASLKPKLLEIISEAVEEVSCKPPLTKDDFDKLIADKQELLRGAGFGAIKILTKALVEWQNCREVIKKFSKKRSLGATQTLASELKEEMEITFEQFKVGVFPYELFLQVGRIMEGFGFRVEKAFNSTSKYRENANKLLEYQNSFIDIMDRWKKLSCEKQKLALQFQCAVEEYALSLFAQPKIKPRFPISEKKLNSMIGNILE